MQSPDQEPNHISISEEASFSPSQLLDAPRSSVRQPVHPEQPPQATTQPQSMTSFDFEDIFSNEYDFGESTTDEDSDYLTSTSFGESVRENWQVQRPSQTVRPRASTLIGLGG